MSAGNIVPANLIELLFDPLRGKMRVVAFASGSGTNFREAVRGSRDPDSGYSVNLLLTDKERSKGETIGAIMYAQQFEIPYMSMPGFRMCGSWQEARKTPEGIIAYNEKAIIFNQAMLDEVLQFEREYNMQFDLAVLAGYMRLFKGPLWRRFNNRAVNVHPADLSVFDGDGRRKYTGMSTVYDALAAGETRTRSSIILVDPETDAGAVLVSGPWVEYTGTRPVTQESASEHQNLQKERSDWPALKFALYSIAHGHIDLHRRKFHRDGNPVVVYQGQELPYEGFALGA
jgi:folate-dependent phosphoribosylglycinamide formyltransferase PurN